MQSAAVTKPSHYVGVPSALLGQWVVRLGRLWTNFGNASESDLD